MEPPLISVITATHNSESTIERCIHSLLSQSFPRNKFEIIVVDDGRSTLGAFFCTRTRSSWTVPTCPTTRSPCSRSRASCRALAILAWTTAIRIWIGCTGPPGCYRWLRGRDNEYPFLDNKRAGFPSPNNTTGYGICRRQANRSRVDLLLAPKHRKVSMLKKCKIKER